ncbi:peptidoglycan recognition protein family protein [Nannocystis pusilla]|uniref:peptidoglycan recognition protein family protein n=1 Tax=Nannocystis pusilla TaxID=889268 RepID=UPI003DA67AEE
MFARLRAPGAPLRDWQWIVVHHTAAEWATLEGIDRYHRKRFGDPLGAEYHFVINNGKKRAAGLVEAARWRYQEPAAHLFKPENAPASLAICLIGNFEERPLPAAMLDALVDLTAALMRECSIPGERVSTHRVVDDKLTQCPGKHFPRAEYLRRIGAGT